MSADCEKLPSTTKSWGRLRTRHAESSVPGLQRGSVQGFVGVGPGAGEGDALGARPRLTQPEDGWQPVDVPIQHDFCGEQEPPSHHCQTWHDESAQQAFAHVVASSAGGYWLSPMHCWLV